MFFLRYTICFALVIIISGIDNPVMAQKKSRKNPATSKKTKQQDPVVQPQKKQDTVYIYIDNKKEKDKGQSIIDLLPRRTTDTVMLTPAPGSKKTEVLPKTAPATKAAVVQDVNPECGCVALEVNTADTLLSNNYINYTFSFKNNCKETVWINSGYFSYMVFSPTGKPVKVLRKLQYVKSYKYPQYVPLKPGTKFDFRFGDDPFFEFDLHSGWKYKFTFIYNNKAAKHNGGKTYLCTEFKEKMVFVK